MAAGSMAAGPGAQGALRRVAKSACDGETTTDANRERRVANLLVGFAPLKPAEFVFIRIQPKLGEE